MSSHSRRDIFPVRVRSSIQALGKAARFGEGMGGMSKGECQKSNLGQEVAARRTTGTALIRVVSGGRGYSYDPAARGRRSTAGILLIRAELGPGDDGGCERDCVRC